MHAETKKKFCIPKGHKIIKRETFEFYSLSTRGNNKTFTINVGPLFVHADNETINCGYKLKILQT